MPDRWIFDSFCHYDHDYEDESYSQLLYNLGFKIFGNWPYQVTGDKSRDPLSSEHKIILIGGSTSSPILGSTWGTHLLSAITNFNPSKSVTIFYGGCGSYSSYNEYLKLSRDIFSINPTHVISLSGTNDTIIGPELSSGFIGNLVNPLVSGNLFTRYNNSFPAVERHLRFIQESIMMNQICKGVKAEFRRFLQPCLGSTHSKYEVLDDDLKDMMDEIGEILGGSESYRQRVFSFYNNLKVISLPECITDISDCLPNNQYFWQDARHPSDKGYALIADKVFQELDLR